jgi:hypothetical protein
MGFGAVFGEALCYVPDMHQTLLRGPQQNIVRPDLCVRSRPLSVPTPGFGG